MSPAEGPRGAARLLALRLALCLTLCLACRRPGDAQAGAAKASRAPNTHRVDLFHREEVLQLWPMAGGLIQSPRYPDAYPRNLLLSWRLLSPPLTRVLLEFDGKFGLEDPYNNVCRFDFVEVEDVSEGSSVTWGRWCGTKAPGPITSKNNQIRITFKSDDFFVAKPGFRICYSLLLGTPPSLSNAVTTGVNDMLVSDAPLSADVLDLFISRFGTVEEILRDLNPDTWRHDLDSIYTQNSPYRARTFHHQHGPRIDLDRLHEDVKQYSCTPRNFSVNVREELRSTNAVFFPRCLLVKRCGGNCACGTDNWNSCTCSAAQTVNTVHKVLRFSPGPNFYRKKTRARWVLTEIHLQHHERCECVCHSRTPR